MQGARDGGAHEGDEENAERHAGQQIAADRAENGAEDDSGGKAPEQRPIQIAVTMTKHRGVERRDHHDDERSADSKMHDIFLVDSLQRQSECQRRHNRQAATQSEQTGHQARGKAGGEINGDDLHGRNRPCSLANIPADAIKKSAGAATAAS